MSAVRHWPGVVTASLTATATVMPGFAVGALAPSIEADLHISTTTVGLAMSAFYGATALGSPLAKRGPAADPGDARRRVCPLLGHHAARRAGHLCRGPLRDPAVGRAG
ncbi:hypothetical protein [Nonomuraea sp. NEAU-A123]|uniref:hypothetical protein n=1 Tax=Nonomuraea sp. NEAU-A123 TaxID=2839649 RepID=UPI001BE411F8|nr:hypothetical protein [Nonomuraea sp. NEAU-A123]MBT2228976.1 hypothetical protein [Nonomuraea sp. NEAU-A123]